MLIPLLVVLVLAMAIVASLRRSRRNKEQAARVAAALGFEMLGLEDALEVIEPGSAKAAADQFERLPAFAREHVQRMAPTCLAGTVDGSRVVIYSQTRGHGKSARTYTVVRAFFPTPLPFELGIGHEGLFTRLGHAFGARDIETGDAEFDRAARVKAGDESAAKALLGSSEVRMALLRLLAVSPSAYATNGYAHWERQGIRFDESELRTVIAALVPVTRLLPNA